MSLNNPSSTTLVIYFSKNISIYNYTHQLFFQNTFNFLSRFEQVSTSIEAYSKSNIFTCFYPEKTNKSVNPIALQQ